ncbi:MAG TPA: S41 family peptidase [Kofleriaceae bacterium]|nr:S41 family peptidase [Kofleriaceae bacterium]
MRRSTIVASHVAAFLGGVVLATALVARAVPDSGASRSSRDRYATLDSFAQALSYIASEYVDEVPERDLVYAAIGGMVRQLDRHSAFLKPKSYQRLREDTEGEFGGVGFELGEPPEGARPPYPVVESLIAGSPAARAGVREGDRIVEIDGRKTVEGGEVKASKAAASEGDRKVRRLGALLRGPAGTRLELSILPAAGGSLARRTLVRELVKVPTVEWLALPPRVGYISIRRFQEATASDVEGALRDIKSRLGGAPGALILDLRGNPGGLYDQGVRVADLFLDGGLIVKVVSRGGRHVETEVAQEAGTWRGFPMIVIVDQGSASAAEIVAAALQDHGRATVLGLPTYGKGSVQTFLDLADGSGLKLTTARYVTPSGRSLEGAGIQPDVVVEAFEAEVISADPRKGTRPHASGPGAAKAIGAKIPPGVPADVRSRLEEDLQLKVAYETALGWLRGRGSPGKGRPAP